MFEMISKALSTAGDVVSSGKAHGGRVSAALDPKLLSFLGNGRTIAGTGDVEDAVVGWIHHEEAAVAPPPPPHLQLFLVAGDAAPTARTAVADPSSGRLRVVSRGSGDGTVLRSSALLDERVGGVWQAELRSPIPWRSVLFLFTDHLGLTRDPAFSDNVLFWLLEQPRSRGSSVAESRQSPTRFGFGCNETLAPITQCL